MPVHLAMTVVNWVISNDINGLKVSITNIFQQRQREKEREFFFCVGKKAVSFPVLGYFYHKPNAILLVIQNNNYSLEVKSEKYKKKYSKLFLVFY